MSHPLVSILILSYNRWDLLNRCLDAIEHQSYRAVEVIVVNQGTDTQSIKGLAERPWVKVITPERNYGFAGGNNIGVEQATGTYVLLLNNDAFLGKHTLRDSVRYLEDHPKVAAVQPTILLEASRKSNGTGSFLTQWGFLRHRTLWQDPKTGPQSPGPIFSALGAGMLIRRSSIQRHGLFDAEFFAYFEETDFCWRLWTRGEPTHYVPTDPMTHLGGETSKAFEGKTLIYRPYRNRIISFWRHLELRNFLPIMALHHLAIIGIAAYFLPKRPSGSYWLLMVLLWELTHPLTLLRTRAQHIRRRTTSDQELWPEIYQQTSLRKMAEYLY